MVNYKLTNGSISPKPLECINETTNKWRVRWDISQVEVTDEHHISDTPRIEYRYYEAEFVNTKPTLDEIKELVYSQINKSTDEAIISGFIWNGMGVWLSTENQFNYKAAYDLAVQTQGGSLPIKFKFGGVYDPVYYEFTDIAEFTDFYSKAMTYVNATLSDGWDKKDNFDWSIFDLTE